MDGPVSKYVPSLSLSLSLSLSQYEYSPDTEPVLARKSFEVIYG